MKKISYVVKVLILIVLASCASIPRDRYIPETYHLLLSELSSWQQFRLNGTVEFDFQAFSLRRPIVISFNSEQLRIDILNTGMFGIRGGILMAMYIDSEKVQVRIPDNPDIEERILNMRLNEFFFILSRVLFNELYDQRRDIIINNRAYIDDFTVIFTDEMKLKEIIHGENHIVLSYDRHGNLIALNVAIPVVRNLSIDVQRVIHENITITPIY